LKFKKKEKGILIKVPDLKKDLRKIEREKISQYKFQVYKVRYDFNQKFSFKTKTTAQPCYLIFKRLLH
jgi:hypothetical protein